MYFLCIFKCEWGGRVKQWGCLEGSPIANRKPMQCRYLRRSVRDGRSVRAELSVRAGRLP